MAVYWISFRLHDDQSYQKRYDALYAAVQGISSKWWLDSTSFIVAESSASIDTLAGTIETVVGSKDLVLIGMPEYKSARLIGETDDSDIFQLMPFVKKA
jgi:hypothetical protein